MKVQWRPEHEGQIRENSTTQHLIGYRRCLEIPGLQESALIRLGTIFGIGC